MTLNYVDGPEGKPLFKVEDLRVRDVRVLDWFTNYLLETLPSEFQTGWVAGVKVDFSEPQPVQTSPSTTFLCSGIECYAERSRLRKQRFVGLSATGFFDWQNKTVTIPTGESVSSFSVPGNFYEWDDAKDEDASQSGLLLIRMTVSMEQFRHMPGLLDIGTL